MKVRITADSTCDLSKDLLEKYNIGVVPLHVTMGNKEYTDGVDIKASDIFDHVSEGGELSSTSAPSPYEYETFFKAQRKEYDAVLHISLSSKISCSYSNAVTAAKELENVYVVDSKNLSTTHGLVAIGAWALIEEEHYSPRDAVAVLNEFTSHIETSFVIKQLDYLHKGGRCSSVAALGANLLNLHPCIEMTEGEMHVGKKYRGAYEKCIHNYVRERVEGRDDLNQKVALITYTAQTSREAVDAAIDALKQYGHFEKIVENIAGCTISCHCGPNTLGVLFARKWKPEQ